MQRLIDADDMISFPYSGSAGTEEQIMDWIEECGLSDEEDKAKMLCWKVIEGFRNVVKTAPTIPAPQWISVEDRLPGENGEYIVTACDEGEPYDETIWNDTVVVCAEYCGGCWTWYENGTEYSLDGIVTHWMPMPEPPDKRYKCRYADDNGVCSKLSGNGEIMYCVEGACPYDTLEGA